MASLKADKAFISAISEYTDFVDDSFKDLATEFPKHTKINNYTIELIKGLQPLYRRIYSLKVVKLEILNTYIKTNLANNFIRSSNFPINTPIFSFKISFSSFWLYINY